MSDALQLDPQHTTLVLIDLQKGVLQRSTAPHSAADVLARSARLATAFRTVGAPVVLVRVAFSADGADALKQPTDASMAGGPHAPDWDVVAPELGQDERDIRITKHQWGAFYGTELDLQLRRRGVHTVVLGGIATNFGVESTARDAYEHGYGLVLVEDAMAGLSVEAHTFACTTIFPRLGRVRTTHDVLDAITSRR